MTEHWHINSHLRVLSKNYPMNTNMTGFMFVFLNFYVLVFWTKVASALEGLTGDFSRITAEVPRSHSGGGVSHKLRFLNKSLLNAPLTDLAFDPRLATSLCLLALSRVSSIHTEKISS